MNRQDDRPEIHRLRWLGSDEPHLDTPVLARCGEVVIGCYGGHTGAGATKNEDGALVWCAGDGAWEFVMLLDAHDSAQSAGLVMAAVEAERDSLVSVLSQPVETVFASLHQHLFSLFRSPVFRTECRRVQGETACLICVRKAQFLWWLSIGDCVVYLFHPDLARLDQYALNQRSFFEWIGRANTFDLPVPCYASGVRELGSGRNRMVMTTDGLLECGAQPFEDPRRLYALFDSETREADAETEAGVRAALTQVQRERGRDSATLIAWDCINQAEGLQSFEDRRHQ